MKGREAGLLKKAFATILIITISVLCLPVFSSASVAVYSDLPEPIPTDNIKYFVIGFDSSYSLYMVSSAVPIEVQISIVNKRVTITAYSVDADVSSDITLTAYRLNNHTLSVNSFNMSSISAGYYQYKFGNFPVDEYTVTLSSYGCSFASGFSLQPCNIVWNDAENPSTYTTLLNNILNKLKEIDTNTDGIEGKLDDINSELDLITSIFNQYKVEQHSDLTAIYNKIDEIYDLLNQDETTRAPAIEQESEVDEILSNEAALNKDFSSDLNKHFGNAGNVFDGNSAFSFIKNMFENLILSVPSLNSLIIFSLAIGLCVLILGRRLNA